MISKHAEQIHISKSFRKVTKLFSKNGKKAAEEMKNFFIYIDFLKISQD